MLDIYGTFDDGDEIAKRQSVMRKHFLIVLAAAIGLAASQASAADVPRKAPAVVPPAPPPIAWTGCYIGANVGGIFGRAETTFGSGEVFTNNSGFAGGGQIGCDYQFSGAWVVGIRNMFDGTSLRKDRTIAFGPLAGGEIDFKTSLVRHPDRPCRLCGGTRLVDLRSGRRGLGSIPFGGHLCWCSNWRLLQDQIRLDGRRWR